MPTKKFTAYTDDSEPAVCAHVGRKRTLRSSAKAGKRSKGSADASSDPLGTLANGNSQLVSSHTLKPAKGPAKKPIKAKVLAVGARSSRTERTAAVQDAAPKYDGPTNGGSQATVSCGGSVTTPAEIGLRYSVQQ